MMYWLIAGSRCQDGGPDAVGPEFNTGSRLDRAGTPATEEVSVNISSRDVFIVGEVFAERIIYVIHARRVRIYWPESIEWLTTGCKGIARKCRATNRVAGGRVDDCVQGEV